MKVLKLLYPGMHLKRWIVALTVGMLVLILGVAYVLVEIYRAAPFPEEVFWVTLQFLPRPIRAILFVALGAGLIAWALWKLNRALIEPLAGGAATSSTPSTTTARGSAARRWWRSAAARACPCCCAA